MTITNGYCTLTEAKTAIGVASGVTVSDDQLSAAINAASRQIDGYTGRRFWQDATAVARTYWADDEYDVIVDDISTTSGLIVKYDSADDGTYATTMTVTTDYLLEGPNVAADVPVWPYTSIHSVNGVFPVSQSGRRGVQVTAKFGWPAVTDDVKQACIIQAIQLAKGPSAPFGVASFGDAGFMPLRAVINPQAAALLDQYVRRRRPWTTRPM